MVNLLDFPWRRRFLYLKLPNGLSGVACEGIRAVPQERPGGGGESRRNERYVMTVSTRARLSDNAAGAIAYFTFLPAFVFLLVTPYKESSYVRFHAWQSVLLDITAFIIEIIFGAIALVTLFLASATVAYVLKVISVAWLVLWLTCVIQAMNGKRFKIPLLGSIAEKLSMK